jgi:hypothetical protein
MPNTTTPAQLSHLFRSRKIGSATPVAMLVAIGKQDQGTDDRDDDGEASPNPSQLFFSCLLHTDYAACRLLRTGASGGKVYGRTLATSISY